MSVAVIQFPIIGQRSRNMAVRFYLAPVTFLLSAVLLRSWLLYCSGFDNDQTTRSLFETNVTKRPLEIGLEAFHRTSRSSRSNAILDHSKSSIILMLKFLLLQCGDIQVNPGPPKHPCGLCNNARNVFVGFISTVLQCPLNLTTILVAILILSGYATSVPFQTSLQLFFSTIWIALRVITAIRASNLITLVRNQRRTQIILLLWDHRCTPPVRLLVLPSRRGRS